MKQSKLEYFIIIGCTLGLLILFPSLSSVTTTTPSQSITQSFVPEALVSLSTDYAIIVDKTMQKVFVFHFSEGMFDVVYEADCSTGKNKGMKIVSGDGRTPEGIYFAIKFYDDADLSSTYGSMAFDLDYPNVIDKKEGKDGNNIWMHGTNKPLRAHQSNGCVTLANSDIDTISRYVTLYKTPVIIQDYIRWVPQKVLTSLKKEMERALNFWIKACIQGNLEGIKALYNNEASMDVRSLNALMKYVNRWTAIGMAVSSYPTDVSILKHDHYTLVTFDHVISLNNDKNGRCGYRNLYLKKNKNKWFIVGDTLQSTTGETHFIARLDALDQAVSCDDSIKQVINNWVQAWESGNMERYGTFYSSDFRTTGMNLNGWISHKTMLSQRNKDLRITFEDITISLHPNRVVATFKQTYRSSQHSDVGFKKLYFKKENDEWKIYRESWRSLAR
ncbi:MAG: L,D-transpeptidase family protein [Deltaproteobacteria bacterium]|nr:L,D-transpeptidase family protein [Deltaproteobacteria bacterium]